ncbi:MAG: DUF4178 domain-containing protein [Bryobacterales bacterium]|nr:DUF4178 domain-containing protein [Bryobacterales bacterium]
MSRPTANCPNCGAPIEFRFSSAVQTTCPYCQSILVRHDVNLEKVGTVADLPPEVSPIQLLTEGIYGSKAFQVVGRIIYEYDQGTWNEWHCMTHDGGSIWLSDAMAQYAITQLVRPTPILPSLKDFRIQYQPGSKIKLKGREYTVTTLTTAKYRGVEGELPFEYWDKEDALFADLRTPTPHFGTIDYSEDPALVFLGEWVEFDALKMKNLRQFEGW